MADAPAPVGPLPRSLRIAGITAAALVLTSAFVYLGFPYDRLALVAAGRLEAATGYRLSFGPVEARPGLLGPGIAVESLRAVAPGGESFDLERLYLRPAWSSAWLVATPALFVDAEGDLGRLRGVARVSRTPGFDGEASGLDLARLLAGVLPNAAGLSGSADLVADVTLLDAGAEGPLRFSAREGVLSHPRLPLDVPYQSIEGELRLGGEWTAEIVSLEIRSPLGRGSLSGTLGRAARLERAPLDLSLEITANQDIRGMLRRQGVRLDREGRLALRLSGTLASPRASRR